MQIVTSHKNTDFDALASIIGITLLNNDVLGVVPKMVNSNVDKFLSTHKTAFNLILPNELNLERVTKLIVVDTDQWRRLDRMEKLRSRDDLEIEVWDHHMNGNGDIEADWKCQEYIGATVTLIVREMKKRKLKLTSLDSTVLLIGLYEDTGHLTFRSTTPEDAMAAAFLLQNGADLNVAAHFLNPPYEDVQRDILFAMMQDTEKVMINNRTIGLNVVMLNKKVKDLSGVVSMYRKIINVEAVFVIFVYDETRSVIIARSATDHINVAEVLTQFGGGGHHSAASATIAKSPLTPRELKAEIKRHLREQSQSGATIADIMSFPVTQVPPSTTMKEVQELMAKKHISGVLVTEGDDILGIVVLWDFKKIKQDRQWNMNVKAFMSRNITTIPPNALPRVAAEIMTNNDIGHLPVVHNGKLIGIVTRTDILTYFYGMVPD